MPTQDRIAYTYETLRELIVLGRLAPGTRVIESAIADRLKVSRTPVRNALQRLQQEGYVASTNDGKRTQLAVAPLTKEDGRELFWIIGGLEGVAACWVAQGSLAERRSIAEELRRVNQDLRAASGEPLPNSRQIFELHTQFHRQYVAASQGPRLQALHHAILPQVERYRRLYSDARGADIHESLTEHEAIIHCIEAGNAAGAEQAVQSNWRNASERLGRIIDATGERGTW